MNAILMVALLATGSPGLARLEQLAGTLERCAARADRLEHTSLAWAEHDRRLLVAAMLDADAAFGDVVALRGTLEADDANDVAAALADAGRALREWSDARDALDRAWMRSAARRLREAIERAQAIVSAAEASAPNS
jgi:hypothetical protein